MSELLAAVSTLQILTHNSLVNIKVPPNSQVFYSFLFNIVSFDIIDTTNMVSDALDL